MNDPLQRVPFTYHSCLYKLDNIHLKQTYKGKPYNRKSRENFKQKIGSTELSRDHDDAKDNHSSTAPQKQVADDKNRNGAHTLVSLPVLSRSEGHISVIDTIDNNDREEIQLGEFCDASKNCIDDSFDSNDSDLSIDGGIISKPDNHKQSHIPEEDKSPSLFERVRLQQTNDKYEKRNGHAESDDSFSNDETVDSDLSLDGITSCMPYHLRLNNEQKEEQSSSFLESGRVCQTNNCDKTKDRIESDNDEKSSLLRESGRTETLKNNCDLRKTNHDDNGSNGEEILYSRNGQDLPAYFNGTEGDNTGYMKTSVKKTDEIVDRPPSLSHDKDITNVDSALATESGNTSARRKCVNSHSKKNHSRMFVKEYDNTSNLQSVFSSLFGSTSPNSVSADHKGTKNDSLSLEQKNITKVSDYTSVCQSKGIPQENQKGHPFKTNSIVSSSNAERLIDTTALQNSKSLPVDNGRQGLHKEKQTIHPFKSDSTMSPSTNGTHTCSTAMHKTNCSLLVDSERQCLQQEKQNSHTLETEYSMSSIDYETPVNASAIHQTDMSLSADIGRLKLQQNTQTHGDLFKTKSSLSSTNNGKQGKQLEKQASHSFKTEPNVSQSKNADLSLSVDSGRQRMQQKTQTGLPFKTKSTMPPPANGASLHTTVLSKPELSISTDFEKQQKQQEMQTGHSFNTESIVSQSKNADLSLSVDSGRQWMQQKSQTGYPFKTESSTPDTEKQNSHLFKTDITGPPSYTTFRFTAALHKGDLSQSVDSGNQHYLTKLIAKSNLKNRKNEKYKEEKTKEVSHESNGDGKGEQIGTSLNWDNESVPSGQYRQISVTSKTLVNAEVDSTLAVTSSRSNGENDGAFATNNNKKRVSAEIENRTPSNDNVDNEPSQETKDGMEEQKPLVENLNGPHAMINDVEADSLRGNEKQKDNVPFSTPMSLAIVNDHKSFTDHEEEKGGDIRKQNAGNGSDDEKLDEGLIGACGNDYCLPELKLSGNAGQSDLGHQLEPDGNVSEVDSSNGDHSTGGKCKEDAPDSEGSKPFNPPPIIIKRMYRPDGNKKKEGREKNEENNRSFKDSFYFDTGKEFGDDHMFSPKMMAESLINLPAITGQKSLICPTCGEEVFNPGKTKTSCVDPFHRMLLKIPSLQTIAEQHGLVVHNIAGDGNCMFSAVVDQLRIAGDFSFTVHTLRSAAVEYLQNNPTQEDGSHLMCFLTDESWEEYLSRMRKDGEWGDHIALIAITEVIGRTVTVLNSSGSPTNLHPHKSLEADDMRTIDSVYLGYIGGAHYVSLRPKDWETTWSMNAKVARIKRLLSLEDKQQEYDVTNVGKKELLCSLSSDIFYIDPVSRVPVMHLSFMIMELLKVDYFFRQMWPRAKSSSNSCLESVCNGTTRLNLIVFVRYHYEYKEKCDYDMSDLEYLCILKAKEGKYIIRNETMMASIFQDDEDVLKYFIDTNETHPGYCRLWSPVPVYLPKTSPTEYITKKINNKYFLNNTTVKPTSEDGYPDVPALVCSEWPFEAFEWKNRERASGWPGKDLVDKITQGGCYLAHRAHPNSVEKELEFQFLFTDAEELLAADLTQDVKYCFYIYQTLVRFQTRKLDVGLPPYFLVTTLLYACESIPADTWRNCCGGCVLYMTELLLQWLRKQYLPHYFIPQNNLIDTWERSNLNLICNELESLRQFPCMVLHFVCEANEIPNTWLIDSVMASSRRFKSDGDRRWVVENVFNPTTFVIVGTSITRGKYFRYALNCLNEAFARNLVWSGQSLAFQEFLDHFLVTIDNDKTKRSFLRYVRSEIGTLDSSEGAREITLAEFTGQRYTGKYKNKRFSYNDSESDLWEDVNVFLNTLLSYREYEGIVEIARCLIEKTKCDEAVEVGEIDDEELRSQIENANKLKKQECARKQKSYYSLLIICFQYMGKKEEIIKTMSEVEKVVSEMPSRSELKTLSTIFTHLKLAAKAKEMQEKLKTARCIDSCSCNDNPFVEMLNALLCSTSSRLVPYTTTDMEELD